MILLPSVESSDSVLGIARVFELNKCEAGRISSHKHILDLAVVLKSSLNLFSRGILGQAANVDLAL
jgi:hypothetical protein